MGSFVRVGSTLINLAAVRAVDFEEHLDGRRWVVLRREGGDLRFQAGSHEADMVCSHVLPVTRRDEYLAELFALDRSKRAAQRARMDSEGDPRKQDHSGRRTYG